MAIDELDEHEQSERVREWVRKNAGSVLLGIVVGIAGLIGWKQWEQHRERKAHEAQNLFQEYAEADAKGEAATADGLLARLQKDYPDSTYAVLVQFKRAKAAMKKDDVKAAIEALELAHRKAAAGALKELAALRLARLRVAQREYPAALALLQEVRSKAYAGLAAALRGDVYLAQGQKAEALTAYEQALGALEATSAQRTQIEMKRNDLREASAGKPSLPTAPPAAQPAMGAAQAVPAQDRTGS